MQFRLAFPSAHYKRLSLVSSGVIAHGTAPFSNSVSCRGFLLSPCSISIGYWQPGRIGRNPPFSLLLHGRGGSGNPSVLLLNSAALLCPFGIQWPSVYVPSFPEIIYQFPGYGKRKASISQWKQICTWKLASAWKNSEKRGTRDREREREREGGGKRERGGRKGGRAVRLPEFMLYWSD